ncbi:MAG: tRNA (adenosine(37)-N6)-threonylcarbamoyltransferase complex ATPase subunit type 1 TsaE [Raineya sp.]|jgi:tRNA threonylcarbamoyladenosine biosynthesis protein TsaE|nr:tRNA (adenosine(37)-N6)-threonylcarbamoyltransferase complex ATPase subunit type 1 TsaE [Raineya sp.]
MLLLKELQCESLQELPLVASQIVEECKNYRVWIFEGQMGAGKTTLIKQICKVLGVLDEVQSPTFSIVNEYHTENHQRIYHFDFYRLRSEQEAYDIGYEEYFYDEKAYSFLEWASKVSNLLPPKSIQINIEVMGEEKRKYTIVEL